MSTPAERRELMLDIQDQVEEHNRAMREEERDGEVLWDPRDDQPSPGELAQMAAWDREAARREADAARSREVTGR